MTSSNWKTLWLILLAPLLVAVVGGLIVEWLKPGTGSPGSAEPQPKTAGGSPVETTGREKNAEANPLIGKWYTGSSVGPHEVSVEFFPGGKLVRESHSYWSGSKQQSLNYRYDKEKGELTIEGADAALVSVDNGRLVMTWEGKPTEYNRSQSAGWWGSAGRVIFTIVIIIAFFVGLVVVGIMMRK